MKELIEWVKGKPWYAKAAAIVIVVLTMAIALFMEGCASTHSVTQQFLQKGDTLTVIRYEQIGSVKK